MQIDVIGGGPAGLYFAILMKKADASHRIRIYERNGPDDTFGWGVVFSGKTLANLRAADEVSHAEITKQFAAWDNVDVVHRSERVSIHGNSFSGIARLQLLKILQRRAEELGVEIGFHKEIHNIEELRNDCDLLLAADGVNSTVRLNYLVPHEGELLPERLQLLCPVCQSNWVHPAKVSVRQHVTEVEVTGEGVSVREMKPTKHRGTVTRLGFWCESGHTFTLRLQFHKGQTYLQAEPGEDFNPASGMAELWRD